MALLAVKRWKFPVIKNDEDKPSENHYYRSLQLAQSGFYPVSINNQVHGGIHFDQNVLAGLGNESVRKVHCIADGEVIAYRVNDNYQKVDYGDEVGFFSTGFVLVRHLLEMDLIEKETPKAAETNKPTDNADTQKSEATANSAQSSNASSSSTKTSTAPATKSKKDKKPGHRLYFYSLYMHLADTKYYDDNPKEPTPAFWEQDVYQVDGSLEYVKGLNIRHDPNKQILGVLQTGTKVNLNLEVHEDEFKWYGVSSLVDGYSSIPILKPYDYKGHQILGLVYNDSNKQLTESIFEIPPSDRPDTSQAKSRGLGIKNEGGSDNISMLPQGTQIKITGEKKAGKLVELTEIVRNGQPTLPLPDTKKMVKFDGLKHIVRGKKYNEVVVLDKPFPIKAGDLVGHIGHNQNDSIRKEKNKDNSYQDIETLPLGGGLKKSKFRPNLHIECFTSEDLASYITKTQTEASKIPKKEKPLLGISKGAKFLLLNTKPDTTVGKPLKETQIKVISKAINIKWLQIEITIAENQSKKLWIENNEAIEKKAIPNDNIELTENTPAWSKHPLQVSDLKSSTHIVGTSLLLDLDDNKFRAKENRAEDEQGTLWIRVEKLLDDKNMPIPGWVSTEGEGVKRVSCWDWFDFKQIKESASLKEFYLSAEKTLKRNKDNSSLDQYTPTIKEVLTILDKQYKSGQEKYAMIEQNCFKGIVDEPILITALARLLINYESEWYGKLNAEGKISKWEELNSEMTADAQNILDYLKKGNEAKCDVYISTLDASKQKPVKKGLEQLRREIKRLPENFKDQAAEKLSKEQLEICVQLEELERCVMLWEKTKEKAKKMLWWDDVVKGLAKQSQQTDTTAENGKGADTSTAPANSTPPATLSKDGKVWFIHPISLFKFVTYQDLIDVESFLVKYESEHKNFKKKDTDNVPDFNQKSKYTLRGIIERINLFYRKNDEFKPNIYYLSYMLATARWEATWGEDVFCALFEHGSLSYFNRYDPVLAPTEDLRKRAKDNGNTKQGDGYTYRGRGLAHLTFKGNYKRASDYFGIDFVKDPDKAAELDNAVPILIWGSMTGGFSTKKLTTYINKNRIDYKAARAVINGSDYADKLAEFAKRFEAILRQTSILTEEF